MEEQKVKIVEVDSGVYHFFFDYDFKSAMDHAQEYVEKHKGKFKMKLYIRKYGPRYFRNGKEEPFSTMWQLFKTY